MRTIQKMWFALLTAGTAATAWLIFDAPVERTMGIVQKIFYIHVPSALIMMLAFLISGASGLVFIIKRKRAADALHIASAEVGLLFCTIALITGPLWAKPVWGSYWTWEPRLTSTLILWLIFSSAFLLRKSVSNEERARIASAVIALFGCLDIPLVFVAVRLWRGLHPTMLGTEGALPASMSTTLSISLLWHLSLAITLVGARYAIEKRAQEDLQRRIA